MTKIAKTDKIVAPSFNAAGAKIARAYKAFDKASTALENDLTEAFRLFVDQCHVAGMPKTQESCAAIRKAIALACDEGTGLLASAVATGWIERKTIIEYGSGAQRAFYHGIDWYPTLKNETAENLTLPWGKTKKATVKGIEAEATKAGAVQVTTLKDAHQTLMKAIGQYRLVLQRDFATELGLFAQARYDDFKFESKSE